MNSSFRQAYTCVLWRWAMADTKESILFTVREETETSYVGERLSLGWKPAHTETLLKEEWKRSDL